MAVHKIYWLHVMEGLDTSYQMLGGRAHSGFGYEVTDIGPKGTRTYKIEDEISVPRQSALRIDNIEKLVEELKKHRANIAEGRDTVTTIPAITAGDPAYKVIRGPIDEETIVKFLNLAYAIGIVRRRGETRWESSPFPNDNFPAI